MAQQFYSLLTKIGAAKIANAVTLGTKVNITQLAAGDGNGTYYNPTDTQTSLVHEVWRGAIQSLDVDSQNQNWLVVGVDIPSSVGGFTVREIGIFDDAGNLLAVGIYPETYKPSVSDGGAKDLYIKMIIQVSNTSVVTLKIDPSVVLATKNDVSAAAAAGVAAANVVQGNLAAHLADYATFKSDTQTDISAIEKELANYKGSTSGTDTNGIDTVIEYFRQDDTLYIKKTLSNPNANGQYLTDTWVEYASNGTTVVQTIIWTYGYKVTDTSAKALPNSWSWVVV